MKNRFFFTVLCRKLKNAKNTVFGYKKWSNPESDEWKSSATPNMWWVSFIRILIRWAEHTSRGGERPFFPPPQLDSCQFEGLCLRTSRYLKGPTRSGFCIGNKFMTIHCTNTFVMLETFVPLRRSGIWKWILYNIKSQSSFNLMFIMKKKWRLSLRWTHYWSLHFVKNIVVYEVWIFY